MSSKFIINNKLLLDFDDASVCEIKTGNKKAMGSNESRLLHYMVTHPGETLSKEKLIEAVWTNRGLVVDDSSLLHCMSTSRKLLDDNNGDVIKTVRGAGYQFTSQVEIPTVVSKHPNIKMVFSCLAVFSVTTVLFYWLLVKFNNNDVDIKIVNYKSCIYTAPSLNIEKVYRNVTMYTLNERSVLIDENNNSLSFHQANKVVNCE